MLIRLCEFIRLDTGVLLDESSFGRECTWMLCVVSNMCCLKISFLRKVKALPYFWFNYFGLCAFLFACLLPSMNMRPLYQPQHWIIYSILGYEYSCFPLSCKYIILLV